MKIFKDWLQSNNILGYYIMESRKINNNEEVFNIKWRRGIDLVPNEFNKEYKKLDAESMLSGKWRKTPSDMKKQFVDDISKMGIFLAKKQKKELNDNPEIINYDKHSGILQLKLKYK